MFPQAEESFLEVLRLHPAFPGVHLELGKVYISLRQTEQAMRELELALKGSPGDADASYFLGGLLAQGEHYAEAIPYLERAQKRSQISGLLTFIWVKPNCGWSSPRKLWCYCSGPWR